MTHDVVRRSRRRRRRRRLPWIAFLSAMILVTGWSGLWFIARRGAVQAMDLWFASEAAKGRQWSCASRGMSGFPLRIALSCKQPAFRGKVGGDDVDVQLAGFVAETYVYQPNAVEATFTGPLILRHPDRPGDTVAAWSSASVAMRVMLGRRIQAAVRIKGLDIVPPDGARSHVEGIELRFAPAVGQPAERHVYEFLLQVVHASLPALDERSGDSEPLTLEQKGTIDAMDIRSVEPWPVLAEAWRGAGGHLDIASLALIKGGLHVAAKGRLGFDEEHRAAGQLQVSASGYETLAQRSGVPVRALSVGNVLAGLLGPKPAADAATDGTTISLPLVLGGGRVSVGPFQTPLRLAPLY